MPETVTTEMLLAEMLALNARMDRIEQMVEELQAYRSAKDAEAAALNAALRVMLAESNAEAEARRMDT